MCPRSIRKVQAELLKKILKLCFRFGRQVFMTNKNPVIVFFPILCNNMMENFPDKNSLINNIVLFICIGNDLIFISRELIPD